MKKGKYIDYNILLACLSKRPQATTTQQLPLTGKRAIIEEFYEALTLTDVRGTAVAGMGGGDWDVF